MVEIRLFAGLRKNREKKYFYDISKYPNGLQVLEDLDIDPDLVATYLINGFDGDLSDEFKDGDIVSIFPAIGGG